MSRFKNKIRYTGDAIGSFADALANMLPQFAEMEFKKTQYEREIELKEKWREEDRKQREYEFDRNQWLSFNLKLREEVLANITDSQEEYDKVLEQYEASASAVSDLDPYYTTQEMNNLLAIESESALDESLQDIAQGRNIVQNITNRTNELKRRLTLMDTVASYMVYDRGGSRRFNDEPLVKEGAIPTMWSNQDFEMMVNDLKQDEAFLRENGLWNNETGAMREIEWFDDYLQRLTVQPDEKLAALNVQLFDNILKEQKALSDKYNVEILEQTWDATANPENVWYQQVDAIVENFDNINKVLLTLPNFDVLFANGLAAAKNLESSRGQTNWLDHKTVPTVQQQVTAQMLEDGYIDESAIINKIVDGQDVPSTDWVTTVPKMTQYLEGKMHAELAQDDILAMLLGVENVKNTFVSNKISAVRYGTHLADAIKELDTYMEASEVAKSGGVFMMMVNGELKDVGQKGARNYVRATEYTWAQRLGLPYHISENEFTKANIPATAKIIERYKTMIVQKKSEFGKTLIPLLGDDGSGEIDLLDNSFMDQIEDILKIRNNTSNILKSNNKSSLGTGDIGMNTNREDGDIELNLSSKITSCVSNGGSWIAGLEICDAQGLSDLNFGDIDEGTQIDMTDPNLMAILDSMIESGDTATPVTGPDGEPLAWAGSFSTEDLTGTSLTGWDLPEGQTVESLGQGSKADPRRNPEEGQWIYDGKSMQQYKTPGTDKPGWFTGDYDGWTTRIFLNPDQIEFYNKSNPFDQMSDMTLKPNMPSQVKELRHGSGTKYYDTRYGTWLTFGSPETHQFYEDMRLLQEYKKVGAVLEKYGDVLEKYQVEGE